MLHELPLTDISTPLYSAQYDDVILSAAEGSHNRYTKHHKYMSQKDKIILNNG